MEWHASDHPQDKLHNYADLVAWAEVAAILSPDKADHLRHLAQKQSQMAEAVFERAIELREAIYRLFADVSEQRTFLAKDLTLLNKALSE